LKKAMVLAAHDACLLPGLLPLLRFLIQMQDLRHHVSPSGYYRGKKVAKGKGD